MTRLAVMTLALLSIASSVLADQDPRGADDPAGELRAAWSVTATGVYTAIDSPEDDDGVGGWFDQYEFTPNKDSGFPFQLGVREAVFDLFRGDSAIFQSRLWSPTSNLGVSGSDVDAPFFDQRLDALTRLEGLDLDLMYRRIRTEQLRIFPDTQGPGLIFQDSSHRDDRFFRDRTGFRAEARIRPYEALGMLDAKGSWIRPVLSVRGGYDAREGERQLRIHRGPSNDWLGLARSHDRSVADVGAGLLVAPEKLLTVAFDFDHQRLRFDDAILTDGQLGLPPPQDTSTIGFVPETNRYTGTMRVNGVIGERVVVEGGVLVSELEQVSAYTPDQRSAGLRDNSVRFYGAKAAFDVSLLEDLSFSALFKYDRRENDIERDTALFNSSTQVAPFVEDWEEFVVEGELELRFWRSARAALGLRYEDMSRDRDFASPGGLRILRKNTHVDADTRIVDLYGRTVMRPWRRLNLNAEVGYRWAPDTGYATDLDENVYGKLRASYAFAFERSFLISGYVRGSAGENDDFRLVSGLGPSPGGAKVSRSYDRANYVVGVTASASPIDGVGVNASVFHGTDEQDASLDLSSLQRYFEDTVPIDFLRDGKSRFENEQTSLVVGLHAELTQRTNAGLLYSFSRVEADYGDSSSSAFLNLVESNHKIESETHVLALDFRHRIVDGLEILCGYRFQRYDDDAPRPESVASVVAPFDRSTHQHTVTVGVTLDSEFFER